MDGGRKSYITNRWGEFSESFPNYNKNYFADEILLGAVEGKPFEAIYFDKGLIVKAIKVWMTGDLLHGIMVKMSDNRKKFFGRTESADEPDVTTEKEIIFKKWEKLTSLTIGYDTFPEKPAKTGGCLRYINIKTDAGKTWEIGSEYKAKGKKYGEHTCTLGSGICCGIFGFADQYTIYSIGFAMLKPVESTCLSNIKYVGETNNYEIIPEVIKVLKFENKSSEKQHEKYKLNVVETTTKTWNTDWTLGAAVTIKGQLGNKLTGFIGADHTISGSYAKGKLNTLTTTATHEYEWTLSIPPKTKLIARGKINNTKLETKFEADMKVILQNRQAVSYKEKGTFTEVSRKNVSIEVKEEAL